MPTFKSEFIDIPQKNILIPALQRDYVQGSRKDIIKTFLSDLFSALQNGKTVDLNYIYGYSENNAFVPIDGQQRLITLWLLHLYLYKAYEQKEFPVKLQFASREFANEFAENLRVHAQKIQKQNDIINSSWFVTGWKYDATVCNMLNTWDEIISLENSNKVKYPNYDNISFQFLEMSGNNLGDDIYIKMNGRGRPLSYFENLKSWMDEKINNYVKTNELEESLCHDWQEKIDNEWTDFFWKNRSMSQTHSEEIDDEQERFFYNMLRIFWTKKDKAGFLLEDMEKTQRVTDILEIEDRDSLEQEILSKISKSENFTLPLTVLDNLNLFSPDFFIWIKNVLDKLTEQTDILNSVNLEFDFDGKETLTNKIFFNNENRHLLCASSIIDYILRYQGLNLHDWTRFIRNIVCNIDNVIDNGNELINKIQSFEKVAIDCHGNILSFLSDLNEEYQYTGLSISKEEQVKAKLLLRNDKIWRARIEKLENNKYFTGQIQFIFDFVGENPETADFDKYAKMVNNLLSEKNSCFSQNIDNNTLSRALLCFSTSYGFGWWNGGRWSFLNTEKYSAISWKKYINGIFNTDEEQNLFLKRLLDYIYDYYNGKLTTEVLEQIIDEKKGKIKDWRTFFVKYPDVWKYMENKFCTWDNDGFKIRLIKRERIGDNIDHAELRSYCLYLDYLTKYPDSKISSWTFNFHQRESTCLYFDKQTASDIKIAIDVYFDAENAKSEDNYTLEIFLRPFDDEDDEQWINRSKCFLKKYITNDFIPSDRGYKLKRNCSEEQIKKKINSLSMIKFES